MSNDLFSMSAVQIAADISSGKLTAEAVMLDHIARINVRDSAVNAFLDFDADRALRLARASDRQTEKGVLHGVPFAVKDIIDTVDLPTSWGSSIYKGFQTPRNASCVEMLVRAGAIPIGKTVTTEFAYFSPGATRNPHNLGHTPGGSSSGSAAAVADGMAVLGLGSQTAASLTRPAAYCGVFGYKASQGSIDLQGVMGLAASLDTLGLLARGIDDLILARAALCGTVLPSEDQGHCIPQKIAFLKGPHWQEASHSMKDACVAAAEALASAGVSVTDLQCPPEFNQLSECHKTIMAFEVARARHFEFRNHSKQLSCAFYSLIETGLSTSRADYDAAMTARDTGEAVLANLLSCYDFIMTPAAPSAAPAGIEATGDPVFSRLWTVMRVPTVTLPFGRDAANLPLAFQLVGGFSADQKLLAHSRQVADILQISCAIPGLQA